MRRALVIALCSVSLGACTAIIGLRDDYTLAPDAGADGAAFDGAFDGASSETGPADGGWFVQSSWAGNVDGSSVVVTLDSGMRAGDLVVVAVGWQGLAINAAVSDPQSNLYKFVYSGTSGNVYQAMFYAHVGANGATTINVTMGQAVQFLDVRMAEYAGPTTLSIDSIDSDAGTSFSATVLGAPGNVLVAAGTADQKILPTSDGGFAVRIMTPSPFFNILQDRIADASANYTATAQLQTDGNAVFQVAAFK